MVEKEETNPILQVMGVLLMSFGISIGIHNLNPWYLSGVLAAIGAVLFSHGYPESLERKDTAGDTE